MAYKDLLVHVDNTKACKARVRAAVKLAQAHEAHLTGLYVVPEPTWPTYIVGSIPADALATQMRILDERREEALSHYRSFVEKSGVTVDCRSDRAPESEVAGRIALHARYADMLVLGQGDPEDPWTGAGRLPERVALASGRPVLVIPYIGPGKTLGERVMVAWDAGREAARAVNDALPMLKRALSVIILTVNPRVGREAHGEQPGADIALHLARHGVKVEVKHAVADDISVGDTILSRLADEAVDLVVMGAYGHSRVRELALGGVTRTFLEHMTVPVLMSH